MKIRPLTRREALYDRAARVSARLHERGHPWDNAHDGFVVGYKAAMRDVRKLVKECRADITAENFPDPMTRHHKRAGYTLAHLKGFLRPLR